MKGRGVVGGKGESRNRRSRRWEGDEEGGKEALRGRNVEGKKEKSSDGRRWR